MHRRPNHQPPLIIVGMHRSGTTMLSQILERMGIFMGAKKERENNEAFFFCRLNEWMFYQANASWDNPANFTRINSFMEENFIRVMKAHLRGLRRIEFLGAGRFLRHRDIRSLDIPWGWKDPKNTFTAGIWQEIFPEARVLHIYRNPLDVSESLRKRENRIRKEYRRTYRKAVKENLLIGKTFYQYSPRVLDISEGIRLWEEYVEKALSLDKNFRDRILHIRYESFLDEPASWLARISEFLDIPLSELQAKDISGMVRSEKKFAFAGQRELADIYRSIKNRDLLVRLGYDDILRQQF